MAIILVEDKNTFNEWRLKFNEMSIDLGDVDLLDSSETNIVAAINENYANIGDLTLLNTTDKFPLVDAINEILQHTVDNANDIGDISTLTTTDKSNLTNAVNELDGEIGDISTLTTDAKTSLTVAVNEIDAHTDTNTTNIGDMVLDTTATDLTDAINEHEGDIGTMALDTTATDLTGAINEHEGDIGDMALDTTATNLSDAIDELHGEIGTNTTDIGDIQTDIGDMVLDTVATNLSDAIDELHGEIGTNATDINTIETNIGDMVLDTVATNLSDAIDELHGEIGTNTTNIGTLGNLTTSVTTDLVVAINSLSDITYLGIELNDVTDLNSLLVYAYCYGTIDDIATPVVDTDTLLDNYASNTVQGVTVATASGTITVPTTGVYVVKGRVIFTCATLSAAYELKLDNDATKTVYDTLYNGATDSGVEKSMKFETVLSLTATDVLSLYMIADTVGAAWSGISGDFSIQRIT